MVLSLALAVVVSAEPAPRGKVSLEAPPVLLMVRAGKTAEQQRRERKLYDELAVALDGFMLMSQDAEQPDFVRLALADQIAAVLPIAQANGASIVVWLGFPLPNQVMLHLIALGSGRALVRTIESDRSAVAESSLALMARELLGTAYLFEPPKSVPLEVRQVVQTVKQQIDVTQGPPAPVVEKPIEPPPPPPPPAGHWALWLRADSGLGLVDQIDAAPMFGLALALERRFPWRLDGSFGLGGSIGTLARNDLGGSRAFTVGAIASVYRGFGAGPLTAGPVLAFSMSYGHFEALEVALGALLPRLSVGAQARLDVATGPAVSAQLSLDWVPLRAELRSATNQVLFRAPVLELRLALGIGWQGL